MYSGGVGINIQLWELAYSGRNYSTKLGIKPACGKRGVYKGGNYSTVVGITVQWWELQYRGGNYCTVGVITVHWWELSQLMMSV